MHADRPEYRRLERFRAAEQFVGECYGELDREDDIESRLDEVWRAIGRENHYDHTAAELEHGARMAWRNSNRCIGRHFWDSLDVLDYRDATTAEDVFEALCAHIEYATNGGNVQPAVSVFPPEIRGEPQVRIGN